MEAKDLNLNMYSLPAANASSWEKKRKPGGGYKLPDTMFSSQPISSDEEELRRLFYVALTRAEKIYISLIQNLKMMAKNWNHLCLLLRYWNNINYQ